MKRTKTSTPSGEGKRIRTTPSYEHGGINYSDLYRKVSTDIEALLSDEEWLKIVDYLNIIQVRSSLPLSPESVLNNDTIMASLSIEWIPPEDNALIAEFINKIIIKSQLQNKIEITRLAERKRREFIYSELKYHFSQEVSQKILDQLPNYALTSDKLEVEKELAEGSHGSVFKIKKTKYSVFALPLVAKNAKPGKNQFLINEIRTLSHITNHRGNPYITNFLGLHFGPNHFLSVLSEFAPRGDLLNLLKSTTVVPEDKIKITTQMALALNYLHRISCLHLDLKPENVLIFSDNMGIRIKLTDLGLSKLKTEFSSKHAKGTIDHMAPEILSQALKPPILYTKKVDVFSFFSVLFSIHLQISRSNTKTLEEPIPDGKPRHVHVLENFSRDLSNDMTLINDSKPEIPVLKELLFSTGKMNPDERPYMDEVLKQINLHDPKTGVKKELPSNAPLPTTNTSSSRSQPH